MQYLQLLLTRIFNLYFLQKYCIVVLSDENFHLDHPIPLVSIAPSSIFAANDSTLLRSLDSGCDAYVFHYPGAESDFVHIFDVGVQVSRQRVSNRRFIIVLENLNDQRANVQSFFEMDILKNMPDILVIYPKLDREENGKVSSLWNVVKSGDDVGMATIYELITRKIDSPEPIVVDCWVAENDSFIYNNDLFPDKVHDMNGLMLNISVIYYPPYDIIEEDVVLRPTDVPSTLVEGIELRVIREYANKYNCTLNLMIEKDLWGDIYENRTGYGLFGKLVEDQIEIGLGAVGSWAYIRPYMETSFPFVRTGVTCLVPVPRLLDKFSVPVLPFTPSLWGAVIFSTTALVVAFFYISYNTQKMIDRQRLGDLTPGGVLFYASGRCGRIREYLHGLYEAGYIIYGMMMLQPLPASAEHTNGAFRNLLTFILLQTLLITTAYSSGLAAIMTLPRYEKPIKTVDDLTDSNIEWGANDEVWLFTISGSKEPRMLELMSHFRAYDDLKLERIATSRKYAYSIEHLQGGSFAIGDYINEQNVMGLQPMLEDIYWEQTAAVFRKSSPFLPQFNQLVFRLKDSGLLFAFERQVALYYLNFFVQQRVKLALSANDDDSGPAVLQLSDLLGVFSFWGVGLMTAFATFIVEIFWFRFKRFQKDVGIHIFK